ncbi:MAG: hypothetical protein Q4D02_01245 [Clostridia bacterium]|nr:hypothetical protein [Clostridia bacterium]
MVDIHCHIIPLVDDGSKSFEETLKMAKKAESLGINHIVATPHYIERDTKISSAVIKDSVKRLNLELKKNGICVELYAGNEIFFTNGIANLMVETKALSINETKYVLFEFPMYNIKPLNMLNEVENLVYLGYIPIIAHPERYSFTKKSYKEFVRLIELGALLQINVGSISGTYGKYAKKNVKKLLKHDMVHLIATDSHDSTRIYDRYCECMKKIKKVIKEEKLNIILENSQRVLQGKSVQKFEVK